MDVVRGETYAACEYTPYATTTSHSGANSRRETSKNDKKYLTVNYGLHKCNLFIYFHLTVIITYLFSLLQSLDSVVLPILNKPKPKVEPPKEDKPKDKPADEQKSSQNQNAQANHSQPNQQQHAEEEKMDVE